MQTKRKTPKPDPCKVVRYRELATATNGITVPVAVGEALGWRVGDQILVKADYEEQRMIPVLVSSIRPRSTRPRRSSTPPSSGI